MRKEPRPGTRVPGCASGVRPIAWTAAACATILVLLPAPPASADVVRITNWNTALRAAPFDRSSAVSYLASNAEYPLVAVEPGWYGIMPGRDSFGWVRATSCRRISLQSARYSRFPVGAIVIAVPRSGGGRKLGLHIGHQTLLTAEPVMTQRGSNSDTLFHLRGVDLSSFIEEVGVDRRILVHIPAADSPSLAKIVEHALSMISSGPHSASIRLPRADPAEHIAVDFLLGALERAGLVSSIPEPSPSPKSDRPGAATRGGSTFAARSSKVDLPFTRPIDLLSRALRVAHVESAATPLHEFYRNPDESEAHRLFLGKLDLAAHGDFSKVLDMIAEADDEAGYSGFVPARSIGGITFSFTVGSNGNTAWGAPGALCRIGGSPADDEKTFGRLNLINERLLERNRFLALIPSEQSVKGLMLLDLEPRKMRGIDMLVVKSAQSPSFKPSSVAWLFTTRGRIFLFPDAADTYCRDLFSESAVILSEYETGLPFFETMMPDEVSVYGWRTITRYLCLKQENFLKAKTLASALADWDADRLAEYYGAHERVHRDLKGDEEAALLADMAFGPKPYEALSNIIGVWETGVISYRERLKVRRVVLEAVGAYFTAHAGELAKVGITRKKSPLAQLHLLPENHVRAIARSLIEPDSLAKIEPIYVAVRRAK